MRTYFKNLLYEILFIKVIMQVKLFQVVYASFVLHLGSNENTIRMSQPNIMVIGNYHVNYQIFKVQCFTNSAERELVSICTQSIRNCN